MYVDVSENDENHSQFHDKFRLYRTGLHTSGRFKNIFHWRVRIEYIFLYQWCFLVHISIKSTVHSNIHSEFMAIFVMTIKLFQYYPKNIMRGRCCVSTNRVEDSLKLLEILKEYISIITSPGGPGQKAHCTTWCSGRNTCFLNLDVSF